MQSEPSLPSRRRLSRADGTTRTIFSERIIARRRRAIPATAMSKEDGKTQTSPLLPVQIDQGCNPARFDDGFAEFSKRAEILRRRGEASPFPCADARRPQFAGFQQINAISG